MITVLTRSDRIVGTQSAYLRADCCFATARAVLARLPWKRARGFMPPSLFVMHNLAVPSLTIAAGPLAHCVIDCSCPIALLTCGAKLPGFIWKKFWRGSLVG